ncbi:MAG: hypothetical protein ACXWYO_08945 [Gaiellaceae bacterium]
MKLLVLVLTSLSTAVFVAPALGAQLIDRNVSGLKLSVNAKAEGLLTYQKAGKTKHVLFWGAENARVPTPGGTQVKFSLDYSGGYGKYRTVYWKTFKNVCGQYDGPVLPNLVAACRAPDGSYWAAQSWPQPLPNLGYAPWLPELRANWLEVSHWTGDLAKFETGTGWVYSGRFESLFGRLTYGGSGVYGFGTTRFGAPTDGFGVLIYLDTFNSMYGPGWNRENSFVPHNPTGIFCYGFYTFDPTKGGYKHPPGQTARRGPGLGEKYRLTASGPGVTPNIATIVPTLHPFDANNPNDVDYQRQQSAVLISWGDKQCRAGLS